MNKLPLKYSELILVAIKDVKKARRSNRYIVSMGDWHYPVETSEGDKCGVCLAGAVMANTLKADITKYLGPNAYSMFIYKRLSFINFVRLGAYSSFTPKRVKKTLDSSVSCRRLSYDPIHIDYPTRKQFGYLRGVAKDLEKAGL